jgi:hypothetical protein
MSWFKKMIIYWARNDWDYSDQPEITSIKLGHRTEEIESDPVLQFKVYSAIGGKIVEFKRYDRQRDRHDTQTYIITSDQDFGERIAKIATMENLKS